MDLPKLPDENQRVHYSIGEVADYLKENASAIRYWSNNFPEIKPSTNKKGKRYYSRSDFETLVQLHYLIRSKKMTFPGAKAYLKNNRPEVDEKSEIVLRLNRVKDKLQELLLRFDELEKQQKQ